MKNQFIAMIFLMAVPLVTAQDWQPAGDRIMTEWGETLDPNAVWQEYPRPQLQRDDWMNLNGLWDYAIMPKREPKPETYEGKILVPFCVESALSGAGKALLPADRLWYAREFTLPESWDSKRVVINFEAVDWSTAIWINDALVGSHQGGYDRFSFDITPYLKREGPQKIVVSVDDPSSLGEQPRGKQQLNQHGIWYTPVSGIWQTVWLEAVSPIAYIKEIKITPDVDQGKVNIATMLNQANPSDFKVVISILSEGAELSQYTLPAESAQEFQISNPRLWSPDDPFLYDLSILLLNPDGEEIDRVNSYFGMRKISLGDVKGARALFLNNKPLFHYGTLDQGWWPDGLHTPPSDDAMRYDLEITKKMGFNMIRKHIKVESARWYYHCDRLGIMVWQDMPSVMVVFPGENGARGSTSLFVGRDQPDPPRRSEETARFEWELRRMMDLHYNAPSIVIWVPFNEGWGQYATCRINDMVKAYDPTRLVNPVSGWSLRPCGDIYDIHSYHTEVTIPPVSTDRASVVGEYGGIGLPVEGHLWNPEMRNWGYQTYQTSEELLQHYKYKFDQIVEMKKSIGVSAAIYTQTTDVEGEVNGLLTYDRKIIKMPVDTLHKMHSVLYEE